MTLQGNQLFFLSSLFNALIIHMIAHGYFIKSDISTTPVIFLQIF